MERTTLQIPYASEIQGQNLPQHKKPTSKYKSFGTQTKFRESSIQTNPCSLGTLHESSGLHALGVLKCKEGLLPRTTSDVERVHSLRRNWIDFKNFPELGNSKRLTNEKKHLEIKSNLNQSVKRGVLDRNRTHRSSIMQRSIVDWSDHGQKDEKERLARLYSRKDSERLHRNRKWNRYKRKETANFDSKNNQMKTNIRNKTSSRIDKRLKGILDKMQITFSQAPSAKKLPMFHKFIETDTLDESDSSFRLVESPYKEDRYEALLNSAFDDIMKQRYKEAVDNYRRASISTDFHKEETKKRLFDIRGECDNDVESFLNSIRDSPLGLMFGRILERLTDLDECDSDSVMMKDLESVTSTMIDNYIESLLLNVVHKIPNPIANLSHDQTLQRSKSGNCSFSIQKYSPKVLTLREFQRKCLNIAHEKFWSCLLNIREKTGVKTSDPIEIEDLIKKSVDESIWTSSIYDEMNKAFSDLKISQEKS